MAAPYTLTWDHGVTAAEVTSFSIDQSEGDFAALTVVIKNPRVGLLTGALFATLSDGTGTLFYGRLIGVPDDILADAITLVFLARPNTYDADKVTLAATLKVDPFWDPVFIPPDQRENPDMVLEARPALWHTDRVTHAVTISDIIEGEAGTTVIDPDYVVYDSVRIRPGETPAEQITCKAEVRWRQKAGGSIDLTPLLYQKFTEANSVQDGYIVSFTGDGLVSDWPDAGTNIGSGWSVGRSSAIRDEERTTVLGVNLATGGFGSNTGVDPTTGELVDQEITVWRFVVVDESGNPIAPGSTTYWTTDSEGNMVTQRDPASQQYTSTYYTPPETDVGWSPVHPNPYHGDPEDRGGPSVTGFAKWFITAEMKARYDVDRERVETLEFTISADVQPLISAREDTNIDIEMQSAEVDQPIDPGGAMPIVTPRRRSYFLTDRGHRSVEYLIALCRARLLSRARAVEVSFRTTFAIGRALSLRHSVSLSDPRLPGGIATGKVVKLVLAFEDGLATATRWPRLTLVPTLTPTITRPAIR
jgi:hypothetical protein